MVEGFRVELNRAPSGQVESLVGVMLGSLATLRVGDIVRRNVQAIVLRPGKLSVNLLGQSFMSRLKGYRFEDGELVLQDN